MDEWVHAWVLKVHSDLYLYLYFTILPHSCYLSYTSYDRGEVLQTNNLIALLNLYEIIFVCIKSSLYEPCTDGGLKYNLSHLFHPQKNKFPFSCQ